MVQFSKPVYGTFYLPAVGKGTDRFVISVDWQQVVYYHFAPHTIP